MKQSDIDRQDLPTSSYSKQSDMPDESEALYNLKNNQQQLDMDGIMVGVSRQALEEVIEEVEALKAEHAKQMVALLDEIIQTLKNGLIAEESEFDKGINVGIKASIVDLWPIKRRLPDG